MKFKLLSLTIISFVLSQFLSGQQINISGKIIDKVNSSPIEYANISLHTSDSVFVQGVNSDEGGYFAMNNAKTGNYLLTVSYLGYETSYLSIDKSNYNSNLGNIALEPSSILLNEATVTAQSVINKADRKLITPSGAQVKASTSGMDLLQKLQLPRLRVDPINNTISISGNGVVQLRINGVEVTSAEITALRPEDIVRIEYHDDPGVRYGNAAAVLDYIIRRKESGGNVNGNATHGVSLLGFADDYLSAKYNNKKSEFSVNTNWRYRDLEWERKNDEIFRLPDQEIHRMEEGLPTKYKENTINTTLNYSLMEKDKYYFNAKFRYNFQDLPNSYTDRNSTLETSYNPTPLTIYDHSTEKSNSPALDLYYQRSLKNEQILIFNVVGTYISSTNKRWYQEHRGDIPVTDIYSNVSGDKYSLIAEGIYERKLGIGKFTAGLKYKQTYANNTYKGNTTADVSMKQAENYIYAEYQFKKGKFGYMANVTGTRFYYSQGGDKQTKYLFQPSARINYNPDDKSYIRYRFNYWGHIPSLGDLNNVQQAMDSLQIRRGNPNLRSNYSLNNNLTAGYDKGFFAVDLFFQYTYRNKPIMGSIFLEDGKFIHTTENQRSHHHLQVQTTFKFRPWKEHLTISVSPGLNRYISYGNNYTHTYTNKFINVNMDATYKNWVMTFWGGTSWDWFYGEFMSEGEAMHMLAVGYNKPNWSVMLGAFNPFGGDYKRYEENWSDIAFSRSRVFTADLTPMFCLRATFNINFGRQFKGGDRRINNSDTDSGIMSGTKK